MNLVMMAVFSLFFLAFFPDPAHAYIDPGVGSMILQIILGGFAGVAIVGKLFWKNIKSFFRVENPKGMDEK
jgi:hypothetical protein